jgi:hypothetical protein
MTRTEAIDLITATLPSLDEEQAMELAEVARSMISAPIPLKLTDEDRANLEAAREDFRLGRTLSSAEARAYSAELAANRRSRSLKG